MSIKVTNDIDECEQVCLKFCCMYVVTNRFDKSALVAGKNSHPVILISINTSFSLTALPSKASSNVFVCMYSLGQITMNKV